MDEILTTIRRIIAEDEQSSIAPARGDAAGSDAVGSEADRSSTDKEPKEASAPHEDVLELTDALNEDGSVRRLAPIGSSSQPAAPREPPPLDARAVPEAEPEPHVEPGTPEAEPRVEMEAPAVEAPRPPEAEPAERAEPEMPPAEPAIPPTVAATAGPGSGLLSEAASESATVAFARLATTPPPASDWPRVGERPLEEVVRDELRPILKTWLDDNLPQLVERLVEAEIARIVRRSGAD